MRSQKSNDLILRRSAVFIIYHAMGMILHKINRPTSDVDKNAGKVLALLRNLKRKTFGLIAIQKSVRQLLLKAEETRGSGGRGRRRENLAAVWTHTGGKPCPAHQRPHILERNILLIAYIQDVVVQYVYRIRNKNGKLETLGRRPGVVIKVFKRFNTRTN